MYTLKSIVRRSLILTAGFALVAATFIPPMSASADSLNPLTERSLTLSSSSPGWSNTDGSGNSTYAPPNSGANGEKTGNYFDFKVSTDSTTTPMKAISFQYCTFSAGICTAPGNNPAHDGTIGSATADLNVNYTSAAEVGGETAGAGTITTTVGSTAVVGVSTTFGTDVNVGDHITTVSGKSYQVAAVTDGTNLTLTSAATKAESGVTYKVGDFGAVINTDSTSSSYGAVAAVPGYTNENPKYQSQQGGVGDPQEAAKNVAGNYIVMYKSGGVWTQSTGWTVATANQETGATSPTGQNNTIVLSNGTGLSIAPGTEVKVLFFANTDNYITNPGAGAFFVKINTYSAFTPLSATGTIVTLADNETTILDGGVTVANVMNQSIQITTKVLETMQFSVGTVDPNTLDSTAGDGSGVLANASPLYKATYDGSTGQIDHTPCDPILTAMVAGQPQNVLPLGNQTAESSLEIAKAYATHSYWRLSSNSSAGATVYYSGHTLSNTVGDQISPIGATAKTSAPGSEQFGLALANGDGTDHTGDTPALQDFTKHAVNYAQVATYENGADNGLTGVDASVAANVGGNASYHTPQLFPLTPTPNYTGGTLDATTGLPSTYAFDPSSDTVPVAIAQESSQVVDCVTAKMRYIANIAATTPAGIYTTKINYIAAPQY